jgi:uncharacterized protein YjbI with pentapeptide repeats
MSSKTTTVQIKSRSGERVLFEYDVPEGIDSSLRDRHALEKAVAGNASLYSASLRNADLSWADLRGADLSNAKLSNADLSNANLSWANLRGVNLSGAKLRNANLSWADLSNANMSNANLSNADLSNADLSNANLSWANLRGAKLSEANLRGADLRGADLSRANLSNAKLRDANLRDADLGRADLSGANLSGTDGDQPPCATPAQGIANLDKIRAILMDDRKRLKMSHWHGNPDWVSRTCAEEVLCGTTHCMAGWLQVCTTEPALKKLEAQIAGILAAPVAAKMFYKSDQEVMEWLESRAYVAESEEAEKIAAAAALR